MSLTPQHVITGEASSVSTNGFAYNLFGFTGACIIVLQVAVISTDTTPISVTSVTDPNGVTYTKFTEKDFTTVNDGRLTAALACKNEIWIGRGTLASTTGTVTVNLDGTAGHVAVAGMPFTGASTAVIDTGGTETWENTTPDDVVALTHTTRTANTAIIWAGFAPSQPLGVSNYQNLDVTFGGVTSDGDTFNAGASGTASTGWTWTALSYKLYSSIQTALAIAGTHSLFNQCGIVFAITADNPPSDPNITYYNHNGHGDRRSTITVTTNRGDLFLNRDDGTNASSSGSLGNLLPMLVDGYPTATVLNNPAYPDPPYPFAFAINPTATAGDWIKFQFDVAENMQGFFTKGSADWNGGVGTWQWYASNDDTTYVPVGPSFVWVNNQNDEPGPTNAGYYFYYKLQMVSGTVLGSTYADAPIQTEFEFQLSYSGEIPSVTANYNNLFGNDHREPLTVLVTSNVTPISRPVDDLVSGDSSSGVNITSGGVSTTGGYFQFQFPRPTIVDEIKILAAGFNEGTFNLDVSNDGSTWTTLVTDFVWGIAGTTTTVPTGNHTQAFTYLRVIGTAFGGTHTWSALDSIYEFQFSTQSNSPLEIGDRTSLITVTGTVTTNGPALSTLIDGNETGGFVPTNTNISGVDITWDFGATSVAIVGLQIVTDHGWCTSDGGDWKMQLWNGAAWVDITGATFSIGNTGAFGAGAELYSQVFQWTNSVAATKYRMLGTSSTDITTGLNWYETNFLVAGPSTEHDITVEFTDEDGFSVEIPFPRVDFTDQDGFDAILSAIPVAVNFKDDHGFTAVMVDHEKPYRVQVIVVTT